MHKKNPEKIIPGFQKVLLVLLLRHFENFWIDFGIHF